MDEDIADAIHYPKCWDTMAYPTLVTAPWEMIIMPDNTKCPTCGNNQGYKEEAE